MRDSFSGRFIFVDGEILIFLHGLILAVVRSVMLMPSMIVAGTKRSFSKITADVITESVKFALILFAIQSVKKQNYSF